jgi:putative methylase
MGRATQKRLVRRLDLEKALQQVQPHPSPKAYLEQYTLPVDVAAELLFIAAYINDDVINKTVVDLGCGTGVLAIGAIFLGAEKAIGVDIDGETVRIAEANAERLCVQDRVQWLTGDVESVTGSFDTALQNPPFGVQKKGADRKFLRKALELAPVVYSLHKSGESNRVFIKRFIEQHGGKVTGIFPMKLNIPRLFNFHTKRKYEVEVDLYRIVRK